MALNFTESVLKKAFCDAGYLKKSKELIKLADYYNTSVDYILGRNDLSISPIKVCKKPLKKRTI